MSRSGRRAVAYSCSCDSTGGPAGDAPGLGANPVRSRRHRGCSEHAVPTPMRTSWRAWSATRHAGPQVLPRSRCGLRRRAVSRSAANTSFASATGRGSGRARRQPFRCPGSPWTSRRRCARLRMGTAGSGLHCRTRRVSAARTRSASRDARASPDGLRHAAVLSGGRPCGSCGESTGDLNTRAVCGDCT